jgi:ketosteroid isomerase-like protein
MKLLLALALGLRLTAAHDAVDAKPAKTAIETMLDRQADAWNRGDLVEFVSYYAPLCTLVGTEITETTRSQVLAHYKEKYPSRGAMGKLTFSDLSIHLLNRDVATVTAHWHLDRNTKSGGATGGVFSLVCQLSARGWQIVLDHTSASGH